MRISDPMSIDFGPIPTEIADSLRLYKLESGDIKTKNNFQCVDNFHGLEILELVPHNMRINLGTPSLRVVKYMIYFLKLHHNLICFLFTYNLWCSHIKKFYP